MKYLYHCQLISSFLVFILGRSEEAKTKHIIHKPLNQPLFLIGAIYIFFVGNTEVYQVLDLKPDIC
jgi:hypothetical protein